MANGNISVQELEYNAEIGRRVEKLRTEKGVSHTELARAARMSPQKLNHYECGLARWSVFRLRLIAVFFMVPVDELLPEILSQ